MLSKSFKAALCGLVQGDVRCDDPSFPGTVIGLSMSPSRVRIGACVGGAGRNKCSTSFVTTNKPYSTLVSAASYLSSMLIQECVTPFDKEKLQLRCENEFNLGVFAGILIAAWMYIACYFFGSCLSRIMQRRNRIKYFSSEVKSKLLPSSVLKGNDREGLQVSMGKASAYHAKCV